MVDNCLNCSVTIVETVPLESADGVPMLVVTVPLGPADGVPVLVVTIPLEPADVSLC